MKPCFHFRVARLHLLRYTRPGQQLREKLPRRGCVVPKVGRRPEKCRSAKSFQPRTYSRRRRCAHWHIAPPSVRPPALYSCKKYWPPICLPLHRQSQLGQQVGRELHVTSRAPRTTGPVRDSAAPATVPPSPKYPGQPSLTNLPPFATYSRNYPQSISSAFPGMRDKSSDTAQYRRCSRNRPEYSSRRTPGTLHVPIPCKRPPLNPRGCPARYRPPPHHSVPG